MQFAIKISYKRFFRLGPESFPPLFCLLFITCTAVFGQVHDDFSDGELLSNPVWVGATDHFAVNHSGQLQLHAGAAGVSALATQFSAPSSAALEWEFFLKQNFAPSGSNYSRFYLISDQPDLSGPLNGYYLRFGEAGSNDAVTLYHQNGSTSVAVCRATDTAIATAFSLRVRATYNPGGDWRIYVDYNGGHDLALEATGHHLNAITGVYSGWLCVYTVSNIAGFYLDDVILTRVSVPDTIAPRVDTLRVMDARSLAVFFSEPLDAASVRSEHFTLFPGVTYATEAILLPDDRTVSLRLAAPLVSGDSAELRVEHIRDTAGNTMVAATKRFLYFDKQPVAFRDVLINEILADPSPAVSLPEAEFIELYNRTDRAVNLAGWTIADPSASAALPPWILKSRQYLIVCGTQAAGDFARYGDVLALSRFPSLNNGGDRIILSDEEGHVIDSVDYEDTWYPDAEKRAGGWSLELIDPEDDCREADNWAASTSAEGGTPGSQNAVDARRPDNTGPAILSVTPVDSITLRMEFTEKLNVRLPDSDHFHLDSGPRVLFVAFGDESLTTLTLTLSEPLQAGVAYTLHAEKIYDCPGNKIPSGQATATFLLPEIAAPGDIIVNEVLFNPRPTGVDFVEVFNASPKVVDLGKWFLRNAGSGSGQEKVIDVDHMLIYPGEYRVFTAAPNVLKGEYIMGREETFVETGIPALNDDQGYVALLDSRGIAIDSIFYSEKMHSPFVRDNEGISLERISAMVSGLEPANWRSASSSSGFASPGFANTNARAGYQADADPIVVEPEIVQLQVANRDFARIRYNFDAGGWMANVRVCDPQGRTIRTIADNEMLGTNGFFRWDGERDNGTPVTTGYYMVWFQVFDAYGAVKTYRKRIAVY